MSEKFLGAEGIKHLWRKILDKETALWQRIRNTYDSKIDNVVSADDSIAVANNNEVSVNLSSDTTNLIEVKVNDGLYAKKQDTYELVRDGEEGSYAAVYHLQKKICGEGQGINVGVDINIPKDLNVASGSIVEKQEPGPWGDAGIYIELSLTNAGGDLYIPVGSSVLHDVDTVIESGTESTNVPTSKAVSDCINDIGKVSVGPGMSRNVSTNTVMLNLVSETKLNSVAGVSSETANRTYPILIDKNGKLAVNIPWTDSTPVRSVAGKLGIVTLSKQDVGLDNVDNTSDLAKPVSVAVQSALNEKLSVSVKGARNGLAELDKDGKVPVAQLPSYVDDVVEYSDYGAFPITGQSSKIYIDRYDNKTYRWSGTTYVEISPSIAIGTTAATAFRGDYGELAYNHSVANKGSAFNLGLYKITTNGEGHVTVAETVTKSDITALGIPGDDTCRTVQVNGVDYITLNTETLNLIGGTNVTLSTSNSGVTISVSTDVIRQIVQEELNKV